MTGNKKTPYGAVLLYNRYISVDKELKRLYEEDRKQMQLGIRVRELRLSAHMTQAELAERTGTTASAISRIENAEYKKHSLPLLQKIAYVLHKRLEIHFVDEDNTVKE